MKRIYVINGPNLNLLSLRDPVLYGNLSLDQIQQALADRSLPRGYFCVFFHSNSEGALIDQLQNAAQDPLCAGVILNPGGYAHTGVALADAVALVTAPVIEVHLSNIHSREPIRQVSLTAKYARGMISGLQGQGYVLALEYLMGIYGA